LVFFAGNVGVSQSSFSPRQPSRWQKTPPVRVCVSSCPGFRINLDHTRILPFFFPPACGLVPSLFSVRVASNNAPGLVFFFLSLLFCCCRRTIGSTWQPCFSSPTLQLFGTNSSICVSRSASGVQGSKHLTYIQPIPPWCCLRLFSNLGEPLTGPTTKGGLWLGGVRFSWYVSLGDLLQSPAPGLAPACTV